jgi:seryl-tRNA synthetase
MLDKKFIRENPEIIKEVAKNKGIKIDIDRLLMLDEENKKLTTKLDDFRAELNKNSKVKPTPEVIEQLKNLKKEMVECEGALKQIGDELEILMYQVPNIVSADTPIGPDESANKLLRTVGDIPKFDFQPKDHMELGLLHGMIDTEKSAIVSGSRFNYLFGKAVLLQFALVQYTFSVLTDENIIKELATKVGNPFTKPFIPTLPPVLVKAEVMKKMDRFEPVDDRYYFEKDDILLVGSAEHTLGPIHLNEILKKEDLPIRYIGYSSAFRREAGAYGKDTTGILRRHQFDKLEMESFTQPEYGQVEQDLFIAIQEYLVQQLGIPYQVVQKCTGDIGGKADFRAVDIECYMPGQGAYRETHTSDYMTDFQARRLNIRYNNEKNEKTFVHMNDATAFAIGRILIAILENYQQADGSIIIPKVLQKYAGFSEIKK